MQGIILYTCFSNILPLIALRTRISFSPSISFSHILNFINTKSNSRLVLPSFITFLCYLFYSLFMFKVISITTIQKLMYHNGSILVHLRKLCQITQTCPLAVGMTSYLLYRSVWAVVVGV